MDSTSHIPGSLRVSARRWNRSARRLSLTGGGPEGNEQLTAGVSVVLLVALAVIGVTILRIKQLISVHLFVGLLLLGPVALKMASTGYRFIRYYTGSVIYREKGPPSRGRCAHGGVARKRWTVDYAGRSAGRTIGAGPRADAAVRRVDGKRSLPASPPLSRLATPIGRTPPSATLGSP